MSCKTDQVSLPCARFAAVAAKTDAVEDPLKAMLLLLEEEDEEEDEEENAPNAPDAADAADVVLVMVEEDLQVLLLQKALQHLL